MKVTDLTKNWTAKDNNDCLKLMAEINELVEEYSFIPPDSIDIMTMERIKREMSAKLQRFVVYYSKIRSYFENNVYLNGIRKQVKSEAMVHLVSEGYTATDAERRVYASEYYIERNELLLIIRERFLLIDESYRRYKQVENALIQSISVLNKEYFKNQ